MTKKDKNIILVDKPKGITSFDVIRILREELGEKKIGHAGTLDPLASGLLIIGIEQGTKTLGNLLKLNKTYEAEIILGEKRTTGDTEGEIVDEKEVKESIDSTEIEEKLNSMVGVLQLPVPAFSAIKRKGEALYKKARRGENFKVPTKEMKVTSVKLLNVKTTNSRTRIFAVFDVSSGTYIRSLSEELGRRLNYPATLGNLRRLRIGSFDVKDAKTPANAGNGSNRYLKT